MDATLVALVTQLFTGLAVGSLYVLLAVGLALIFGVLGITNFAHGAFFALGAYVGLTVLGRTGNFWLALALAPLVVGLLGLAVERGLMQRIAARADVMSLLLTYGLAIMLVEIIKLVWGKTGYPPTVPAGLQLPVNLGFAYFPAYRLFVIGLALVVTVAVILLLERTDWGLIIRAATQDREMVSLLGVENGRFLGLTFALGVALAGLAGVAAGPIVGIFPEMGTEILIESFVVVVVGGLGSLRGAIAGGLLIGLVISFTTLVWPAVSQLSIFILMALVLLFRPQGLLGRAA
jgi:branched-chain amino acid transport system permease protein